MQTQRISTAAAMLADPSRAAMVLALMDGRSRSAKKLALDAGVTPQTASAHLRKLVAANMLTWQGQGRSKYFSLAGTDVAQAVEALSEIGTRQLPAAARDLRFARCCYDHLAGQLGVQVTERLLRPANTLLHDFGIDLAALESSRRPLFRCCTDWTERGGFEKARRDAARQEHVRRAPRRRTRTIRVKGSGPFSGKRGLTPFPEARCCRNSRCTPISPRRT